MSNTLSKLFIFAAGATMGSVVTLCLVRAKYEKRTLDEIRSIRELYEKDDTDEVDDLDILSEEEQSLLSKERREEYAKIVSKYGNASGKVSVNEKVEEEEDDEEDMKPYVIPPDEFDENGYDTNTLYWYEDGVVTYAYSGDVVDEDDIDDLIGEDAPNHFGEWEDDTVYIRNDLMKTDFELCRAGVKYSEAE